MTYSELQETVTVHREDSKRPFRYHPHNLRLAEFMRENKISANEMAKDLGFSYQYVNRLQVGGRQITDAVRWRFARAYGEDVARRVLGERSAP